MNNHQIKIKKILTSFGIYSILLGVNNNNVYSRYVLKNESLINQKSTLTDIFSGNFYQENFVGTYLVDNSDSDTNVLISEIVIEGWEDHPEGRKLELADL
tara:strand:+ start:72 stop:371 length:300 start_codon:yes stop_codon:yes gene_type:complete